MKVSKRSKEKFDYFSQCEDVLRLPQTQMCADGQTALECFHSLESFGKSLPCCEPELLDRALNGKEQHGMTVTMLAEDYLDRLIFCSEIEANYPEWMANEVYSLAEKLSSQRLGYTPTFVKTRKDFTTI